MALVEGTGLRNLDYYPVASGDSNYSPDVHIEPGVPYRLTIKLPIPAPGWLCGAIQAALQVVGVNVQFVDAIGNSFVIYFIG